MKQAFSKILAAAFAALGLALVSIGPAQSAVFQGAWDPKYGQPFDTPPEVLGWRGNAMFEVPDACIPTSGGLVLSSACTGMQLINAQVVFYDYLTDATIETFNYTSTDLSGFSVNFGVGGVFNSLTSRFFAQRNPVSDFANIDLYGFRLQFVEAGVRMYHTVDFDIGKLDIGPIDPKYCYKWVPGFVCGYSGTYSDGTSAPAVVVTYTRVPEPGSLPLLLVAGAALWAATGRRSRRNSTTQLTPPAAA